MRLFECTVDTNETDWAVFYVRANTFERAMELALAGCDACNGQFIDLNEASE